jgi:hypothetical protein
MSDLHVALALPGSRYFTNKNLSLSVYKPSVLDVGLHSSCPMFASADSRKGLADPPIPGYQGYIPRVHVSDVGLGERFHAMAKSGYEALYTERDKPQKPGVWNQSQDDQTPFTYIR